MTPVTAFLVDFQSTADVAGKRQTLHGWAEVLLRAALTRNRIELMNEPDSVRCRQLLSGSILIRCELAKRHAGAALGEQPPAGKADAAPARFA
jgi:hypothetical protein